MLMWFPSTSAPILSDNRCRKTPYEMNLCLRLTFRQTFTRHAPPLGGAVPLRGATVE